MPHYDFIPKKTAGRNAYVGRWDETESRAIDLPFSAASLRAVLAWGANPDASPYNHQDIAHWCGRFRMETLGVDAETAIGIAAGIAAEVRAQWDLHVANVHSPEELRKLDFSRERMPVEWFDGWAGRIENA